MTNKPGMWDPVRQPRDQFKYVDVSAVSSQCLQIVQHSAIDGRSAPSRARKVIEVGDTIFATIRPALKRIAQVPNSLHGEIASTAFCVLRPDRSLIDPDFLFFSVSQDEFVARVAGLETGASYPAVRDQDVLDQVIPLPPMSEQKRIAAALKVVWDQVRREFEAVRSATDLKQATMRALFMHGLRGEAPKDTSLGPIPESWLVSRLEQVARVVSTRLSYTDLERLQSEAGDTVKVLGVKVSDMNLEGNETELRRAALEKRIERQVAAKRCAPPGTIVFPKRGAAIATNKKRLTTEWTVFDPNLIGVAPLEGLSVRFLFHWFQMFDLRSITEPGPTPQLNKKHLDPLPIAVPSTVDEQNEVAAILDALDQKVDLHRQRRTALKAIFKALLHKLMTGEVRLEELNLLAIESTAQAVAA